MPIELTVGQLASLTGLSADQVRWRMDHGGIPHRRLSASPRARRVVLVSDVERLFPQAYEALLRLFLADDGSF
jgi:hypothetical protein